MINKTQIKTWIDMMIEKRLVHLPIHESWELDKLGLDIEFKDNYKYMFEEIEGHLPVEETLHQLHDVYGVFDEDGKLSFNTCCFGIGDPGDFELVLFPRPDFFELIDYYETL